MTEDVAPLSGVKVVGRSMYVQGLASGGRGRSPSRPPNRT